MLHKLYMMCIYRGCDALQSIQLPEEMFAYRKGYQSNDQVHTIRQTIEKANEWNIPLCVGKTDLLKAFDRVKVSTVVTALKHFQVPPYVIAAIVREWLSMSPTYRWNQLRTGTIRRYRGIPQGDSLAPMLFNIVMYYLLLPIFNRAPDGRGFKFASAGPMGLTSVAFCLC